MRFVEPQWLWGLAAIPFLYVYVVRDIAERKKRFATFADPAVWTRIAPEIDWDARLRKARVWLAALMFALVAVARPQWGVHEETVTVSGLDLLVALDVSNSMEVEDVVPSRLKKAKHLVRSIIDQLRGDRVGLVAFAASAYLACPLTTDLDYVLEQIDIQGPKMIVNQGTDIGLALEIASKAMDRGAEESGAGEAGKASRAVILISDGEDQEERALEGAKRLKDAGVKLYVFGVGTEKGGPVPVRDDGGQLHGYKRDRSGQAVVSTFRSTALTEVAAAAGGRYWTVTPSEGEVEELLHDLGALNRSDYSERKVVTHIDRYQLPLAVAVLLVFLELCLPARKLKALLPRVMSLRRGIRPPRAREILLGAILLLSLGAIWPMDARAAERSWLGDPVPLDAWLENRKGLGSFKDGKVDEAKQHFGSAQALDPMRPELQFNQGVVQMQQGEGESAAQGFAGAAKGAIENGDAALAGKSLFNLGGVLGKKGDLDAAVRSYLGAIEQAQASKDAELEADARKNIELLIRKREQQKQQQQQGQQKDQQDQQQSQQQQQQKDQKGSGDSKQEQKQAKNEPDKKGEQQQYQDPSKGRKREFRSLKLSKEDANRVMAELSNRERDLQAKLKKQRGAPQDTQKDW